MDINDNLPIYTVGSAAKLLDVHPRTLRIYEAEGLIKPHRNNGNRLFSKNDLVWINCIRRLIHEENISIPGIKKLLEYAPCWKIKNCPEQVRESCEAFKNIEKKCWELAQKSCERSCERCEVYISKELNTRLD